MHTSPSTKFYSFDNTVLWIHNEIEIITYVHDLIYEDLVFALYLQIGLWIESIKIYFIYH